MKIDKITLYNFGSYEGEASFDTLTTDENNIVLIGGKNGAGKTTLFTAIRICLYGYKSMGYKNLNSFYMRAIAKLINNNAKIERPTNAYVSIQISISNGREVDAYNLTRKWMLENSLTEVFAVEKNGCALDDAEVADFEKYLISLIPPELFNLYFFDGEKIADFFLEKGSNDRIKEAFMTICGYDTFEIMRRNFIRISSGGTKASPEFDEYLSAKDTVSEAQEIHSDILARLKQCNDDLNTCEADIVALEKDYYQKGGITQEEWNNMLFKLKEEERKRETSNTLLRKWANELVPFLMIRDQIEALKKQIEKENSSLKYRNFCEVIESPEIKSLLKGQTDRVLKIASDKYGTAEELILDFSLAQSARVSAQINQVLEFDAGKIEKHKRAIKRSLASTAKTRKELDGSSISTVQEYMQRRAQLFEEKSALLVQRSVLEQQLAAQKDIIEQADVLLSKVQSRLEDEIKQASINDISVRAVIMLDKLQSVLFRRQIEKMESFFRKEINTLMSKANFIDYIQIDEKFNIHIYRTEKIAVSKLIEILTNTPKAQIPVILGEEALSSLKTISSAEDIDGILGFFNECEAHEIDLPFEIDKTSLSNGEKQIFIMALYHSLVQLCNHEIPFIIDTPFARIDTEHRRNISKFFFSRLKGQVFILSTNEEIDSDHVKIMNNKIYATYLLENSDNKRTVVVEGSYFEV